MAIIYQKNGESVYDDPVKGTVSAKTGQPISATIPPQDTINSDVLSGGTSPTVVTPTNTPLTTPDSTDFTPIEATPQETELSGLIKSITETNLTLPAEKSAFQAEEEKRLGLEQLKVSETDLFSQLKQHEAEFKNLETEDTRIQQRLQLEATGRGITAGGLAPIEAGELRKNFLRKSEKAAEINVTAALLAATQNKFLTAQTLVDRAVANKYGAREAQLKAEKENLTFMLQDPTLTVEQTNRANKQLAIKNKKEEAEKKKREDAQKIVEWAVDARKNGATDLEAQSIAKIGLSDIPDLQKAFEIYSKFQKPTDVSATAGSLEEFKLVHGRMPNNLAELNQFTASRGAAGRAPEDTEESITIETRLIKTRGEDGYIDPSIYLSERTKVKMGPDEFDKRFGYLLSPQERQNLHITKSTEITARKEKRTQELLLKSNNGTNLDALTPEELTELYSNL